MVIVTEGEGERIVAAAVAFPVYCASNSVPSVIVREFIATIAMFPFMSLTSNVEVTGPRLETISPKHGNW